MAALALVGSVMTGCSNEDDTTMQHPQGNRVVTLTTTVTLGGTATTRALSATGQKTFAVGDQIAIVYKNTNNETVKAVSTALVAEDIHDEGKKADITVTLTDPAANGTLRYIYPAAMAKATISASATINDAGTIDFTNLDSQDGTLTTLASS